MKNFNAYGRALTGFAKLSGVCLVSVAVAGCLQPEPSNFSGTLGPSNSAPVFSSVTTTVVSEGSTVGVYTATADDADSDPLSFAIAGGADQAAFTIDSTSGALSFIAPPDFEAPGDGDANNIYIVDLEVNDGNGGVDQLSANIQVTNANEVPIFTSAGSIGILENTALTYTASAFDPDLDTVSFVITGGADQSQFSMDAVSGQLSFNELPDFEAPADSNSDNAYVVQVGAHDGNGAMAALTVTVIVTDVSQIEVSVTFPTPNANLGDVDSSLVAGNLVDLEDGIVNFGDVNYIDVNGLSGLQDASNPTRWSAAIPVAQPIDTLNILADTVGGGLSTANLDIENNALILRPDLLVMDGNNNRLLVGDSGGLGAVVSVGLSNGVRSIIADANNGSGAQVLLPEASVFDPISERVLVVDSILGAIVSLDLVSGDRTLISDSSTGSGPSFITPLSIALDSANDRAYVIDADLAALVAVDLTSGDRAIVSSASIGAGAPLIFPTTVVFDAANSRALVADVVLEAIVAVDPANGDRTVIADGATGAGLNFPLAMAIDAAADRVLVGDINVEALISVDLLTGAGVILSDVTTGTGPLLSFPRSLTLNDVGDRLFVVDTILGEILEVNLASGDRTLFAKPGTGGGPSLQNASASALDVTNNRALVAENSEDGPGLVWVDLHSGDRSDLSSAAMGSGAGFDTPTSVALDIDNDRALVLDDQLNALVSVDFNTGDRSIVSDATIGSGVAFSGPFSLALDSASSRALVADSDLDALLTVDLATGDRSIIADAATGAGPQLTSLTAVVLDAGNGQAFVLDTDLDALLSIDLGNGNRTVVSDAVTGAGPAFIEPLSAALDAANNRMLVADGSFPATLVWVDLASGDRSVLSDLSAVGPILWNVLSLSIDHANLRAFAMDAEYDALFVIDLATGQRAIASQ